MQKLEGVFLLARQIQFHAEALPGKDSAVRAREISGDMAKGKPIHAEILTRENERLAIVTMINYFGLVS